MHPLEIEHRRIRLLHRVPPAIKLLVALGLVTTTAMLPRRPDALYWWPAALLGVLWLLSGMPLLYTIRRLLLFEFFIVGIGLMSLLAPASKDLFLSAFMKSNLCIFAMLLLTWTTPFPDILQELRRARLPAVMITTLALMSRYLPVLAEESARMQRARASRTFSRQHRLAWRNLANITAQLFIRSADRAERIYLAMCARGWK